MKEINNLFFTVDKDQPGAAKITEVVDFNFDLEGQEIYHNMLMRSAFGENVPIFLPPPKLKFTVSFMNSPHNKNTKERLQDIYTSRRVVLFEFWLEFPSTGQLKREFLGCVADIQELFMKISATIIVTGKVTDTYDSPRVPGLIERITTPIKRFLKATKT